MNGKTTMNWYMNWYRWTERTHAHGSPCKWFNHRQCNESRYNICQTKYALGSTKWNVKTDTQGFFLSPAFALAAVCCPLAPLLILTFGSFFLLLFSQKMYSSSVAHWQTRHNTHTRTHTKKHFKILQVTLNIVNVELLQNLQLICSHENSRWQKVEIYYMWSNNENEEWKKESKTSKQQSQAATKNATKALKMRGVDAGQKWRKHLHNEKLELKESFNGLKVLRHFLHM